MSDHDILQIMSNRLERLETKTDVILVEAIPAIRIDIATLKVKAAVWGSIAAILVSCLANIAGNMIFR